MTGCEENGAAMARWSPMWRRGMGLPESGAASPALAGSLSPHSIAAAPPSDRSLSDLECGGNPAKREPHRFSSVSCNGWATESEQGRSLLTAGTETQQHKHAAGQARMLMGVWHQSMNECCKGGANRPQRPRSRGRPGEPRQKDLDLLSSRT